MEGNRHERVALLITSYIIGFITAFIAYGLTGAHTKDVITVAAAPAKQSTTHAASAQAARTPHVEIYKDEDGLRLESLTSDAVLLSAAIDMSVDSEYIGLDGAHYSIPFFSVSPDRSQVYFCEQPTPDSEVCKPFVYSIDDEIVYPVLDAGKRVEFEIATHSTAWNADNQLVF